MIFRSCQLVGAKHHASECGIFIIQYEILLFLYYLRIIICKYLIISIILILFYLNNLSYCDLPSICPYSLSKIDNVIL